MGDNEKKPVTVVKQKKIVIRKPKRVIKMKPVFGPGSTSPEFVPDQLPKQAVFRPFDTAAAMGKAKKGTGFGRAQLNSNSYNMFDIFDKNRDDNIAVFEIYTMFSSADGNQDYSLSPDELIQWVLRNEKSICYPYKRIVQIMMRGN